MQPALKIEPPPLNEDAHGVIRIAGTRVTLDSLIDLYDQGASAEEIALCYDVLDLHEVYSALGYYLAHRAELDAYRAQQRSLRLEARAAAEQRCPPADLRARLEKRRRNTDAAAAG